jgi:Predicted membrane protein (DUF2207)
MRLRVLIYGRILLAAIGVVFFPGAVYTLDFKLLLLPSLLLGYYFAVWLLIGRRPKAGVIVPIYAPPDGMSPAEMRYLLRRGSDRKSVAAVLVHLDYRKVIRLEPESGGYRITLLVDKPPAELPAEEASAFDALAQIQSLEIPGKAKNPPHTLFMRAAQSKDLYLVASIIAGSLNRRVSRLYFKQNLRYSLPAVAVSIVAALASASVVGTRDGAVFLTLWFLLFALTFGIIFVVNVVPAICDAFRGQLSARNVAYTFLPLPIFLGIPGGVAVLIARATTPMFAGTLIALVVINVAGSLMARNITPLARQRLDEIAGFRHFLSTVELDCLDRVNDPHLTPALRNDLLAYAIALDLKEAWGDRLSDALFMVTTSSSSE